MGKYEKLAWQIAHALLEKAYTETDDVQHMAIMGLDLDEKEAQEAMIAFDDVLDEVERKSNADADPDE